MSEVSEMLHLTEDVDAETAIFIALGAASACWENLQGAGMFDSSRAKVIGEELLEHLRRRRLVEQ